MTAKKQTPKCCDQNHKGTCRIHSKIKLQFLLKREYEHLKYNGYNPTFYSYVKHNNKPDVAIIADMLRRLQDKYRQQSNLIQFRNNETGEVLKTLNP